MKITEDSDFYIKVSGEENLEALDRELFTNYPELSWRDRGKISIKRILSSEYTSEEMEEILTGKKYVYIHINPGFRLSYASSKYTVIESNLPVISHGEIIANNMPKSQLLSWLNK